MHEFELGVWKSVFTHLIRILVVHGETAVQRLNLRYRDIPTFGRSTIRRFGENVSSMKKLAARNFEDILQVHKIFLKSSRQITQKKIRSVQSLSLKGFFQNPIIQPSLTFCLHWLNGMRLGSSECTQILRFHGLSNVQLLLDGNCEDFRATRAPFFKQGNFREKKLLVVDARRKNNRLQIKKINKRLHPHRNSRPSTW